MAWKKIAVSGSNLHLKSIEVGDDKAGNPASGTISSSGKLYANTVDGTSTGEHDQIVISAAGGELKYVARNQIQNLFGNSLTAGSTLGGLTYNGNAAKEFAVDMELLSSGGGLENGTTNVRVGQGNNITVTSTAVHINSGSLVDTARGLAETTANKIQVSIDENSIEFIGGEIAKIGPASGGTAGAALTFGDGITGRGGSTYDFGNARVMIVDTGSITGQGLVAKSDSIQLNQDSSSPLATNQLAFFNSDFFEAGAEILDNGSAIRLGTLDNGATLVKIPGSGSFIGSASFAHSSDFEVSDQFILVNSSSAADLADAFGYAVQTGSVNSMIMAMSGSEGATANWATFQGNAAGSTLNNKIGDVRLHFDSSNPDPNFETPPTNITVKGNTIVAETENVKELWFYTG